MTKKVPRPAGSKLGASQFNSAGTPQQTEDLELPRAPSPPRDAKPTRQDIIGPGLKRLFEQVVEEPVPDEFLALLDQIDSRQET